MKFLALIMLNHKRMAMRTLPTNITCHCAMNETDYFLLMAAILAFDDTSTSHQREAQVFLIRL